MAEIVSERDGYTHAITTAVLEPSPHRVTAPCPEIGRGCGGCPWQSVDLAEQRRLKTVMVAYALARNGIEEPALAPTVELPAWGHRTTVRAAVHDGRAAYHRARSDQTIAVGSCAIAHPLVEELLVAGRYPGADSVLLRGGARTRERMAATTPATATMDVPTGTRDRDVHELAAGRRWRISAHSFFQT